MGASWCKVASNLDSHPKIRKAGAMGREVFLFALRRNAEPNNAATPGRVPKADLEPWYVADQLMRTEAEACAGIARCVAAVLLREEPAHWAIVGWDEHEWGREKSTERVREWRKKRDETFRNVSVTPVKRTETDETARSDQIRSEETRREEREIAQPVAASRGRSKAKPKGCTEAELAGAGEVLSRLSERSGRKYGGSQVHVMLVVSRLRAGFTVWDMRRVIGYCAIGLEWEDKPDMQPYLRPETLFGPKAMEKYIYAARAWMPQDAPPADQQDRPPKASNAPPKPSHEAAGADNVIPLRWPHETSPDLLDPAYEEPPWMTSTTPK